MDSNWSERLAELKFRFGLSFNDPSLLVQALTHFSYADETHTPSNAQLASLGAPVILLIVAEYLYANFGELDVGDMDELRKSLTGDKVLANIALQLRLQDHVLLGQRGRKGFGLALARGDIPVKILTPLTKALVGALYRDQGLEVARDFVTAYIILPGLKRGPLAPPG